MGLVVDAFDLAMRPFAIVEVFVEAFGGEVVVDHGEGEAGAAAGGGLGFGGGDQAGADAVVAVAAHDFEVGEQGHAGKVVPDRALLRGGQPEVDDAYDGGRVGPGGEEGAVAPRLAVQAVGEVGGLAQGTHQRGEVGGGGRADLRGKLAWQHGI